MRFRGASSTVCFDLRDEAGDFLNTGAGDTFVVVADFFICTALGDLFCLFSGTGDLEGLPLEGRPADGDLVYCFLLSAEVGRPLADLGVIG